MRASEPYAPVPVPWWYAAASLLLVVFTAVWIGTENIQQYGLLFYHPVLFAELIAIVIGAVLVAEPPGRHHGEPGDNTK